MRQQAWLSAPPTDTTSGQIGNGIWALADMLLLHGRVDEARVVLERAVDEERADRPSRRREFIGTLGVIAGMQGDRRRALEIYQDLEALPWQTPWLQALFQARIAASLGEIDRATELMREVVGMGYHVKSIHFQLPFLSLVLQDHPPFQELIRPKG